jgi:hypothetical protein
MKNTIFPMKNTFFPIKKPFSYKKTIFTMKTPHFRRFWRECRFGAASAAAAGPQ